ncbi:hypothetical protein GQ43DRAFT_192292 [Delitschia confertaspora ATCC 74209]|uniref:DNA/RNA-binding domain-containing protein n=1 Tax=Delitschia confertaspora ATCC 74209 TaxID=1513339 RepID=A0A9P4MYG4_9PLEO|nr:hypothetical protein GQ43DRAFT_192292 [Delitschia confertaspora ATCC 74209]
MDYMVLVAHLRQKNERLETLFTYYGFPVSPEKLQSHENRCGIQHRDIDIQKPPQHIAWTTPSTPTAAELLSQGKPPKASSSPESKERSGSVSPYQLPDVEPTLEQVRPAVINEKSNDTIRSEHQNSQISTGYSKKQAGTPGHSLKKETPLINPERRQRSWAIQLQSESTPVSVEQLSSEVKSIYAGLAMIETKCIAVDRGLVETINSNEEHTLSTDQWQALTALHKTLLHEHHDFLLVSQHPLASPPLRRLAKKYSMTARMWKHGCHSYLELLRRHLPRSLDHMHAFLYHAIQIYNLLYEFIPAFEDIWTEILGDLSRYKMVIEEDPRDREIWARNARSWYTRMADLKPMIGRLDHHMAILSGHNPMCKLFFYAKSLTSENIFFASRDYMTVSLQSASDVRNLQAPPMNPLLKTHISIFLHKFDEAQYHLKEYLDTLSIHLLRDLDKWAESGAQIAIANISSLFDYGNSSALRYLFDIANFLFSMEPEEDPVNQELPDGLKDPSFSDIRDLEGERVKYNLILNTFKTVLSYRKRPSTFPHVQCIAAFLVSLAEAVQLTNKRFASSLFYSQSIFDVVPWEPLCDYLNDFQSSGDCQDHTVPDTFPHSNTLDCRPLPEDYMLRGLVWTNQYFPETWFDGTPWDVEDRVEGQIWSLASSMNTMRVDRILWLGRKLAAVGGRNHPDAHKIL